MLDRDTVDRLRSVERSGSPVLSLYLGLGPDIDELRAIPARVKGLVKSIADTPGLSKDDVDEVVALADASGSDLGRGVAVFVSSAAGLRERISLPGPVRDRAVADPTPYVAPLEAMLDHYHRYCAAVIDRRDASIYRFHMGALESWEVIGEEEVRKDNFGGFSGYEEHRVRGRAGEVARRLFRAAADRLAELVRAGEFDLLAVGGGSENVDGLVAELAPDVRERLAGTFTIDARTATPSDIRLSCVDLAAGHDRRVDSELVEEVTSLAAASNRAVMGTGRVVDAVNQKAVERLLVAARTSPSGTQCPECSWVALDGDICPACGSAMHRVVDLVDSVVSAVRRQGGEVRYLLGDTPLADEDLAAVLRYELSGTS